MVAIIILLFIGILCIVIGIKTEEENLEFGGIVLTIISVLALGFMYYINKDSQYMAEFINKRYGTHYTAKDIYHCSDIIKEVELIKQYKIEMKN